MKMEVMAALKPPFKHESGYIFDSEGHMVADDVAEHTLRIRGWGRLQHYPGGAALQDAIGDTIAQALTEFWDRWSGGTI